MKVVLFAGGFGTRLRDFDETLPKPMVTIGYRPIMWHLMKYYAHHGHKDFVLCLGHKADVIKHYFRDYDETLSNDFVLSGGGSIELLHRDIDDWRITFADTGIATPIGERLRRVQPHVAGEEIFLANYTDCLTDMDLEAYLAHFHARRKVAAFVSVAPNVSTHYVATDPDGVVSSLTDVGSTDLRVNGGFFIFRKAIFDYIEPGDELVVQPFRRLIEERQLIAYRYDGFWRAMDTFKDKQQFDDLYRKDRPPWEIWRRGQEG